METGDLRTALAVVKDEAGLQGLYDAGVLPGKPEAAASPMDTRDVVNLLAGRLRQIDQSELPTGEKSRLTVALADALLRAIGVSVIDKRLEALQAVLGTRKDKET